MRDLPPLDCHAHISPEIDPRTLEGLGAVTLIATRSVQEFQSVAGRSDLVSVWGVGCHPSLVRTQAAFDAKAFQKAMELTPFVAEVGLDGGSRVPLEKQQQTLRAVLGLLEATPRIVSVHSHKATGEVLALLAASKGADGLVLHWWRGDEEQTARAIALGCYFSINFSMIRLTDGWRSIPLDRVLVETDHPAGDRFSVKPRQPGRVQPVEAALAAHHNLAARDIRLRIWANFARMVRDTNVFELMPVPIRRMVEAAAPGTN
ncbi:TatD family hydrolase [Pseudolysinimonas yzui]|uniref:TatD family hydrolase n=1 Tax=Pseudolysinimonas yzui TaxID=2708254 RepID=A0A8J3GPR7_9MICO|nr:TatD family hydrolase [Pseudolysinimonas yzui]GHF12522.1 TatD family hydrolase [Pseudolysinimonas yzui]